MKRLLLLVILIFRSFPPSNTNEISATLVNKGVTEEKLEQDVQDALALARTALQSHQDISGKKNIQNKVSKTYTVAQVLATLEQDEQGVITTTTRNLTPADIGTLTAQEIDDAIAGYVDPALEALDSSVAATAEADNKVSVLTGVTQEDGTLTNHTEVTLEAIAKTGNVNDLIQTTGDVLVFNCGSASEVI